jgi:hypothetical protein
VDLVELWLETADPLCVPEAERVLEDAGLRARR